MKGWGQGADRPLYYKGKAWIRDSMVSERSGKREWGDSEKEEEKGSC